MAYVSFKNNGLGQASAGSPSLAQGISSILNPLIQTGANIFLMEEQAKLQEDALKHQQVIQPIVAPAADASQQTLIIVIAGIGLLMLLMIMLSNRGSSGGVQVGGGSGGGPVIVKKIVRRIPSGS